MSAVIDFSFDDSQSSLEKRKNWEMTARMKITGIIFSIPICMHAQTYSLTIANNAAQEGQQCHEE